MTTIGLIPAAGYGTRLGPLPWSKEMYPVGGRPVMDHLVVRMLAAHCDDLRVVTRPDKLDVIEHSHRLGASVVIARPASLSESLAEGLEGVPAGSVVLIGFPDSVWHPIDGYNDVLDVLEDGWDVALGLFRPDPADLPRYEPVSADDTGRVTLMEFKPARPRSDWIWGCAATRVETLRGLAPGQEPGDLFAQLAAEGRVGSTRLSDDYIDMGTPDGLRRALAGAAAG